MHLANVNKCPYEDAGRLVLHTRLKPILWRKWRLGSV